jgi:hypothetical protein
VARLAARPGVDFIAGLRGFQQTTDYTCVNAWRFFSLWFEAHHFARELWYTRIAVRVPERRAEGVQVP